MIIYIDSDKHYHGTVKMYVDFGFEYIAKEIAELLKEIEEEERKATISNKR